MATQQQQGKSQGKSQGKGNVLAGIPAQELEAQNRDAPLVPMSAPALDSPQQFGLFSPQSAALDALAAIDPDELTPKQALEALYRLKALG